MINVFSKNRSTVGNLVIALLFIGGCVFVLTGSWNAPKTVAASGCCGGGQQITMDAETTNGSCCKKDGAAISSPANNGCGTCTTGDCNCDDSTGCSGTKSCPVGGGTCCYNYGGAYQCQCSTSCGNGWAANDCGGMDACNGGDPQ
ncbi:MAG: hypothetical protein OXM61_07390 [Candidatus Poribacteria bacterium]|nr:hypothetical protein [Candidatus Poribacteria bacterium]